MSVYIIILFMTVSVPSELAHAADDEINTDLRVYLIPLYMSA